MLQELCFFLEVNAHKRHPLSHILWPHGKKADHLLFSVLSKNDMKTIDGRGMGNT